ncbi:hypothetical protein D5018_10490 [Parashewanella curva]|uniref:Uncharacterized protein n=1 Tax=Parashewanella curva TaxID=2338552 RepID=A0A3L8PZ41_9GAMM|nr:hypothetical protein [Parashewanella curva]RLV59788.1 hypothetical protein D5018_10490 [Parashewanella curva]
MNEVLQDLKAVMNDIQQRKEAINRQIQEFQSLQAEIQSLMQRAKTDPEAREKLLRLQRAFPQGFNQQQQKVMSKVNELGQNFKKLEQQFTDIGSGEAPAPVVTATSEEAETQPTQTVLDVAEDNKPKAKKKKVRSYL